MDPKHKICCHPNIPDRQGLQQGGKEEDGQIFEQIGLKYGLGIGNELRVGVVKVPGVQAKGTNGHVLNRVFVKELRGRTC